MTERQAFLAAIIANPDEDMPRLSFADWLEEHGECEVAKFVRYGLRCRYTHIIVSPSDDVHDNRIWCFYHRAAAGRKRSRAVAATLLDPSGFGYSTLVTFRRGFAEHVTCTAADWLKHADALHWHPSQDRPCPETAQPVRRVTLTGSTAGDVDAVSQLAYARFGWRVGSRQSFRDALAALWPGVAFEMPELWAGLEVTLPLTYAPPPEGVTFQFGFAESGTADPPALTAGTGAVLTVNGRVVPVASWTMTPDPS